MQRSHTEFIFEFILSMRRERRLDEGVRPPTRDSCSNLTEETAALGNLSCFQSNISRQARLLRICTKLQPMELLDSPTVCFRLKRP